MIDTEWFPARTAAFLLGLLGSLVIVHALGYRVAAPSPTRDTATNAREGARISPQNLRLRMQEAQRRHARAAEWARE
ncbi:MAG TPA: hypothetical protein VHC22_04375 [Pirellulales bacterium]|nr:hypothetical protein [Pirellulales bacterium]